MLGDNNSFVGRMVLAKGPEILVAFATGQAVKIEWVRKLCKLKWVSGLAQAGYVNSILWT